MATSNARVDRRFNEKASKRGEIQNASLKKKKKEDNATTKNSSVENATRYTTTIQTATERFGSTQSIRARILRAKNNDEREQAIELRQYENVEDTAGRKAALNSEKAPEDTHRSFFRLKIPMLLIHSYTGFCSFWKFIFGIFAIVFIGAGSYELPFGISLDDTAEFAQSTLGAATLWTVNAIGFFFGFHIELPPVTFTSIGLIFWGITLLFVFIGYIGAYFMIRLRGNHPFHSTASSLGTAIAIAFDITPFAQVLFPCMMLWAWLVSLSKH